MRSFLRSLTFIIIASFFVMPHANGQSPEKSLNDLKRDRVYSFLLKDGTCKFGELAGSDKQGITIRTAGKPDLLVPIAELIQFGQGEELFYNSRSSWLDLQAAKLYARESMSVELKNGDKLTGKPMKVDLDSITLRQTFSTKTIRKDDVRSVITLKLKPATASFEFVQEEAGFFQIFYPEFYERAFRAEARVPVRLYDTSLREDRSEGIARCDPHHISGYKP